MCAPRVSGRKTRCRTYASFVGIEDTHPGLAIRKNRALLHRTTCARRIRGALLSALPSSAQEPLGARGPLLAARKRALHPHVASRLSLRNLTHLIRRAGIELAIHSMDPRARRDSAPQVHAALPLGTGAPLAGWQTHGALHIRRMAGISVGTTPGLPRLAGTAALHTGTHQVGRAPHAPFLGQFHTKRPFWLVTWSTTPAQHAFARRD